MTIKTPILTLILIVSNFYTLLAQTQANYLDYHRDIIKAEELIAAEKYTEALAVFEGVFAAYDFVFLRDYKVAAQLTLFLNDKEKTFHWLKTGIEHGLTLKEIQRNTLLQSLRHEAAWKMLQSQYATLQKSYSESLNQSIRTEVQDMFKRDQQLAFANLFIIGKKAKERFLHKKFIPQSEQQLARLNEIINQYGYPGEKLIGNWTWMSTILSHHNSISTEYVRQDTIYPALKPRLTAAILAGELSPYDYAIIEDWYVAVKSDRKEAAFGYLNTLTEAELPKSNELRQNIGMRSIAIRNRLVDIQAKTGIDFYLAGSFWNVGKIDVVRER